MKIAIASMGKNLDSEISPQTGRAPYYLVFDEGKLVEVWKNVFSIGGGGAGSAVAKIMADKGVEKIVSSNFGDKMKDALTAKDINFEEKSGIVKDVL